MADILSGLSPEAYRTALKQNGGMNGYADLDPISRRFADPLVVAALKSTIEALIGRGRTGFEPAQAAGAAIMDGAVQKPGA